MSQHGLTHLTFANISRRLTGSRRKLPSCFLEFNVGLPGVITSHFSMIYVWFYVAGSACLWGQIITVPRENQNEDNCIQSCHLGKVPVLWSQIEFSNHKAKDVPPNNICEYSYPLRQLKGNDIRKCSLSCTKCSKQEDILGEIYFYTCRCNRYSECANVCLSLRGHARYTHVKWGHIAETSSCWLVNLRKIY